MYPKLVAEVWKLWSPKVNDKDFELEAIYSHVRSLLSTIHCTWVPRSHEAELIASGNFAKGPRILVISS